MPSIDRRRFIAATTAALAAPSLARAQAPVTIKIGALKLIHSIAPHFYERFTPAGYKVRRGAAARYDLPPSSALVARN